MADQPECQTKNETGMIVFPNAKINLGLKVVNKRPDGFHNIETVFYPVGLHDILEAVVAEDGIFSFETSGLPISGDPNNNLCVKAYNLLAKEAKIPKVKIHLHKVIPMGAGIGGGSSDGAFMIKLLDQLFSLGLAEEDMTKFSAILGSDCSFFIRNKVAFGQGKGDNLSPSDINLSAFRIAVIVPDIHVDTREAYEWIDSHAAENATRTWHHPFYPQKNIPVDF